MTNRVQHGRRTSGTEGGVTVFLIGMRINRFRALRHWLPVFTAMPRMLRELRADAAAADCSRAGSSPAGRVSSR